MPSYKSLNRELSGIPVEVYEMPMPKTLKGLYADDVIWLNKRMTSSEKVCVLAEELGHYHTSTGDIIDQRILGNRKQEKRARNWAYEKLIPLSNIIQSYKARVKGRYEIAEYLEVTEEFLECSIRHYQERYGLFTTFENRFIIYFEPLAVLEIFE